MSIEKASHMACTAGLKEKDLHINIDARRQLFVTKKWLLSEKNKVLLIRMYFEKCLFLVLKMGVLQLTVLD